MISLEEALELVLQGAHPIDDIEWLPLVAAVGRFLAENVVAVSDLPGFDNSAMDGWAMRSADVRSASADRPVTLKCVGHIPAGTAFTGEISGGQCARIFTGAPVPRGAD